MKMKCVGPFGLQRGARRRQKCGVVAGNRDRGIQFRVENVDGGVFVDRLDGDVGEGAKFRSNSQSFVCAGINHALHCCLIVTGSARGLRKGCKRLCALLLLAKQSRLCQQILIVVHAVARIGDARKALLGLSRYLPGPNRCRRDQPAPPRRARRQPSLARDRFEKAGNRAWSETGRLRRYTGCRLPAQCLLHQLPSMPAQPGALRHLSDPVPP